MKTLLPTYKYVLLAMVIVASLLMVVAKTDTTLAAGLAVPITSCPAQDPTCVPPCPEKVASCNPIIQWIQFFVNVLTVVIVAGSAVMIAIAGLQYMSARDNAQGVQAAKQKIMNVFIGLLSYFFLYGFMQWLIPGGVF